MNYIGAKNKLLPFLDENITEVVGSLKGKVFCDIFAGTGAVGRYFKTRVSKIIANVNATDGCLAKIESNNVYKSE